MTSYLKHLKFIVLVVAANILISLFFVLISHYYLDDIVGKNTIKWSSAQEQFIVAVLLAPFLETVFYQLLPYVLISYMAKKINLKCSTANYTFIFAASLLFACAHQYNWLYVIAAFIGGITLNYSYVYFKREKFYPYLAVVSIHLLYNLIIFVLRELSE